MASFMVTLLGTALTIASFGKDAIEDAEEDYAKIGYIIANDGANGELTDAGGHIPDVRAWDDTAEFLDINVDADYCEEGYTTCTTTIASEEAPTYTLFTGNTDAICIAWTGISFPGAVEKYGFHPGQWAHGCDSYGEGGGSWYYAGTSVPGIDYNKETVYCAWVDKDGDMETTGFQVHWPEFDGRDSSTVQDTPYYCESRPPIYFRTDYDPSTVYYWPPNSRLTNNTTEWSESAPAPAPAPSPSTPACKTPTSTHGGGGGDKGRVHAVRQKRQSTRLGKKFDNDPRVIKSFRPNHSAAELCDPDGKAVGQSFVSYAEKMFCYMPTKTLFPFCDVVQEGACWDDATNRVVPKGRTVQEVPDLRHITKPIVWE